MLENCHSLQERWGGVSDIIDRWLDERKTLIVAYTQLSATGEFDSANPKHGQSVQQFCEVLVDYVSAGHFEVFQQLISEADAFGDSAAVERGEHLLEQIQTTTEFILDFNDKYLETDDLDSLKDDLCEMGPMLATRFEHEDGMIERLHNAHLDQASAT